MKNDSTISFTDCMPVQAETQVVIPPAEVAVGQVISVQNKGRAAYHFMARSLRRFRRWLTVTEENFLRKVVRIFIRFFVSLIDRSSFNRSFFVRVGGLRL